MKKILFLPCLFVCLLGMAQAVGIGTNTPNSSSVLDLGPSAKPLVLPRLSSLQMNGLNNPALGMLVYNTDEGQLYSYIQSGTFIGGQGTNRWQPVSTGPRMLAWGIVDSFGTVKNGSSNYNVIWDAATRWYRITLSSPHKYYSDSMLLMVTPIGGGSWDQAVSTQEWLEAGVQVAAIKFVDVSRLAEGFNTFDARRRSIFHFTLYDLRKQPY